ncbi:MAG: adenylate/guanylate cyclase domain-containing response regulator [Verrucomicrobia bacterium]|nr:MAG: adenylate/guanylate cyclase domain-containing response regulator [Verrucomicrobiota bacterium]
MLSAESIAQGTILVVDDLEENRDLLHRRLSRLGYAVRMADNGQSALEATATQQPLDLILLDIMMPGLNGIDVLHRLKASPATQHIPVIMLSSADQIETVVRCIKLGADDFLAKPFNETLLMARIESSLSKKRLRDQESAFLRRLQIEQETSERLLLNILPKPIAERLKQGEKIIADSFADATVLFSDFVNFTHLSSDTPPKELVGNLNEIFSAFDYLCEQQGLEKIKTIGDGYMAVSGVPTPNPDHAEAAAKLALAMQAETAGFAERVKQPFQIRIGLNSGPVVAGVIGARKFAYDLWGDNVNIAKHMEASAPPGGILVAQATYERLRDRHAFQPAQLVRVKGGVEMATYLLTP